MKIEPLKTAKLPKYAAALTAFASAALLAGCAPVQPDGMMETVTEPESSVVELEGVVGPFTLEEQFASDASGAMQNALANAGLNAISACWDYDFPYHGRSTAIGFRDAENRVTICFYDGAALPEADSDAETVPDCADLNAWYAHFAKQTFDWGCADFCAVDEDADDDRTAFVDIAKFDTLSAADAAQILSDLRALEPDSAGEEETT